MPEAPPVLPVALLVHGEAVAVGVLAAPAKACAVFPRVAHVLETSMLTLTIIIMSTHRVDGDITQRVSKSVKCDLFLFLSPDL